MAAGTVGLDTGFFVALLAGQPDCVRLWQGLVDGHAHGVACCLSLAELRRLGFRGALEPADVDLLWEAIPAVCTLVWLDTPALLERAARLAHGEGLPLVDALILAGLEAGGANEVWTTDADLTRCARPDFVVRLLPRS